MGERLVFNNVFDSVVDDPAEAAELQFRSGLIMTLVGIIESNGWKKVEIAKRLDVPQPRVSDLMRGKLHNLSSKRLIGYLRKLGHELHPRFDDGTKLVICNVEPAKD